MSEFYLRYNERNKNSNFAWAGGEWLVCGPNNKDLPLKFGLIPREPLNFTHFKYRLPKPDELRMMVDRKYSFLISEEELNQIQIETENYFGDLLYQDFVDGRMIEIKGDSVLEKLLAMVSSV